MPDFAESQTQLTQARAALDAAQAAAFQAAQRLKAIQANQQQLAREAGPQDDGRLARLERLAQQASQELGAQQAEVQRARQAVGTALGQFAGFSDPRRNVSQLSDRSPFLLLPVRLETRFATVGGIPPQPRGNMAAGAGLAPGGDGEPVRHHSVGSGSQLWVRIYPDDCSIDTFEPDLSDTELANAKLYWQGIWRAGGVEADQRAAWRGLVTSHGSGRASWIVDHYQPVNLAEQPVKAKDTDEILVIPTQTPLAAAEAMAIATYWEAIWQAGDDQAAQNAARGALEAAVGAARAAQLIAGYAPYNLADRPAAPLQKSDVAVSTAFVVFPPDPPTKQSPWTQAPRVNHLADRFVVIGYTEGLPPLEAIGNVISLPLIAGPDPSAPPADTIHPEGPNGEDLFVPDELQWMVDFDRAVAAGMGLRIDLTAEQARLGFDRLLVLGLQLSAKEADAQTAVEELLQHHHFGRSGLSVLAQGTPTHNTTGSGTGYTRGDDPDASFDDRKQAALFVPTDDPWRKQDGQWLAELLGVDPAILTRVHGSGGADQMEARAMQRALWPATLGYWMETMMKPVFGHSVGSGSDDAVENTRWFFTSYVSGRGPLPAIRIGGQPYGILPTTAFSRIRWLVSPPSIRAAQPSPQQTYLMNLFATLRAIDADWAALSSNASFVGKPGDAHQLLLDIVGLHPDSAEYHSRYAESLTELFNIVNLWGIGPDFWQAILALGFNALGMDFLRNHGYTGDQEPAILQQVFLRNAGPAGNVVDDRPLSETAPIRAYTDDGRNYIQWLIDAAKASLDVVYQEHGFTANRTPETLLYLYLRHALMVGYHRASYDLHRAAGFLSVQALDAMKAEPAFIHVADGAESESRFAPLYKVEPRITGDPTMSVARYITANIGVLAETRHLAEEIDALQILANTPTARLERAFAEHVDCCSYRFDAWLLALVSYQLQGMRYVQEKDKPVVRRGVYLGAYAWLENLRPSQAALSPVQLPPDLEKNLGGPTPLWSDPTNGGYIHAPSLPHAKAAAVLRSGYLANADKTKPDTMNVNLSSDRVRLALSILEGIRNGQSLSALLGYRFERGLHDDHGLAEVDKFIYPLRKAFPLVADSIATTKTPPTVPIEAIEARNVLDGLKLVTHVRTTHNATYPFGLTLPPANPDEAGAINAEVNRLLDVYDAVGDLALAEGVYQAVQGNFERIAGTLNAYTTGNFPPEPEVIQTPPSGIGLTHRVALHLESGLGPPANATPRSTVEPALDAWLESILPPLTSVGCIVTWQDPLGAGEQEQGVTLDDLKLRPLDLLALVKPDNVQSMAELDDRILRAAITAATPRPDVALQIQYLKAPPGTKLSIFEVMPLLRHLRALIDRSRPLRATDATLHGEATSEQDTAVFIDKARLAVPKGQLDTLSGDIGAFLGTLGPLVADPVANRAALVNGIDGFREDAVGYLERAAAFNVPLSGWGFALSWKQGAFADLFAKVEDLLTRWNARLAEYEIQIAAYDALPAGTPDADRFKALRAAELLISTVLDPLPATPAALLSALSVKQGAFAARRDQFQFIVNSNVTSFTTLLADVRARLPIGQFDTEPFDLAPFEDRAIQLATDLVTNLTGHRAEIEKRRKATQAQLDAHDAAASAPAKVAALQSTAKALLGEDARIIPEFSLSAAQGNEWENALAEFNGGALLQYLTTTGQVDLPVDEWLYGAARVRPNLRTWEALVMLAGAFEQPEPELVPIQLPYEAGAPWLALQYPGSYNLNGDRLLYTAQYVAPFDKTVRQCGLLLDEWTEVIPADQQTTGITFNFDRPNNEAPQTMLLVTPATANGAWQWDDLVGALNETLDLAKKRAVEPVHLDNTAFSRFLPATVMAAAVYGISITTSLAAANGVFRYMEAQAHA